MRNRWFFVLAALAVSACTSRDLGVRSYSVEKAQPPASTAAAGSPPTANAGSRLAWSVPKGWSVGAASSMRLASFVVPGDGDASIVVLGGEAGGMAANVNRWRGQVGLAPADESAVLAAAKVARGALGDFRFFHLEGKESSILGAIFERGDRTVFVKLVGKAAVLKAQLGSFLELCKSLKENDGQR
jgi:hypothetical protein